jgi:hypothetical protein
MTMPIDVSLRLIESPDIANVYFCKSLCQDARCIVKLHRKEHSTGGMMGQLGIKKIHGGDFPNAWKGCIKGKEGNTTITLEAVSNHDLLIWHDAFER